MTQSTVRVLFFARARELAGCAEDSLRVQETTSEEQFWEDLIARYGALSSSRKEIRLARNGVFLQSGELLRAGDEVALIPPVSGG